MAEIILEGGRKRQAAEVLPEAYPSEETFVLFDDKIRTSQEPKSYGQTDWAFLDQSGRVEAQRVRKFLSDWVSEYPHCHRDELIKRVSGADNRQFHGAIFELVIYALLRSLGCLVEVHTISDKRTRPDFLATTPDGESVYIEATLKSEYSDEAVSAHKLKEFIYSAIEKICSPNFLISVEDAEGQPKRAPSGKRLRVELEQWLASLDPDAVDQDIRGRGYDGAPVKEWKDEGWHIVFVAIPKPPDQRGKDKGVISGRLEQACFANTWKPIRDAVKYKGSKCGKLPHPLVIAVNVDPRFYLKRIDEIQGLFGQLYSVPMRLRPNGAWYGPDGPRSTRVSGAWIFDNLTYYNIVGCRNTIYFNPYASKPVPALFTTVNPLKVDWIDGRAVDVPRAVQALGDLLRLPANWPHEGFA